jgi:hypothetical protein
MVPNNSPIMRSIDIGDAEAITELLSSRRASPFDRDENNLSLLQVGTSIVDARTLLTSKRAFLPHRSRVIKTLLEWCPSEAIDEGSGNCQ